MFKYYAKIEKIYDGDGVFVGVIDLGFNMTMRKKMRVMGIDAPEMKGKHRQAGIIARDYVRNLILGKTVKVQTFKDKTGKYGRLMIDIVIGDTTLSQLLLEKGYAVPYDGGKKTVWTDEMLQVIVDGKEPKETKPVIDKITK